MLGSGEGLDEQFNWLSFDEGMRFARKQPEMARTFSFKNGESGRNEDPNQFLDRCPMEAEDVADVDIVTSC